MTDRVAVIGAGPVGLYAAFRLVQAGHRVVIYAARQYTTAVLYM